MGDLSASADTALVLGIFSIITLVLNHILNKSTREKAEQAKAVGEEVKQTVGQSNGHGTLVQMVERLMEYKEHDLDWRTEIGAQVSNLSSRLGTTEALQLAHERSIHDLRMGHSQLDSRVAVVESRTRP